MFLFQIFTDTNSVCPTTTHSADTGVGVNTSSDTGPFDENATSSSSSKELHIELSSQVAVEIEHLKNDITQLKRIRESIANLIKEGSEAKVCLIKILRPDFL